MSKICKSCSTENVNEAKFCRKCGEKVFDKKEKESFEILASGDKADKSHEEQKMKYSDEIIINDKNFFFDSKNEPKFLFLIPLWLSFFALLIILEQQGVI